MPWTAEQLDQFEAERERHLAQATALEVLLREAGRLRSTNGARVKAPKAPKAHSAAAQSPAKSGLRDAIRNVLQVHSSGLRPNEVKAELEKLGFNGSTGKTSLGSKVASELSRMRRSHKLLKVRGKYLFPEHNVTQGDTSE